MTTANAPDVLGFLLVVGAVMFLLGLFGWTFMSNAAHLIGRRRPRRLAADRADLRASLAARRCCKDHHYTCCASFDDYPPTPCCAACPCAPRTPTAKETHR